MELIHQDLVRRMNKPKFTFFKSVGEYLSDQIRRVVRNIKMEIEK